MSSPTRRSVERPASARPAPYTYTTDDQPQQRTHTIKLVRPSSAFSPASLASTPAESTVPTRPATAARERSRSPTQTLFHKITAERPPFRPSSGHPRDATFYSSTYLISSTAGVTQKERERKLSPSRPTSASTPTTIRIDPNSSEHDSQIITTANTPRHASSSTPSASSASLAPSQFPPAAQPAVIAPAASVPVAIIPAHTRRSSEHMRKVAMQLEMDPPGKPSTWTEASLRAHYEPLLRAKQDYADDLSERLKKQDIKLKALKAWKYRALDAQSREVNPLDYVLSRDGEVVESVKVKKKRIIMQRTIIRQFVRTFRLLRSLKTMHRQLRTTLPLLVDSPNSILQQATRERLRKVIASWGTEPLPTSLLSPNAPISTGISTSGFHANNLPAYHPYAKAENTSVRFSFDSRTPRTPGSPSTSSTSGPFMSPTNAAAASAAMHDAPMSPNSGPQPPNSAEYVYFREHPHSHTQKLIKNLFEVVPLLADSISQNLEARREIDQKNYDLFRQNTDLIHQVTSLSRDIETKSSAIAALQRDVELVEGEMTNARSKYSNSVDKLQDVIKREHILLRKMNHLYYKEVAEKLGEPYAIQLSIVQQGSPYTSLLGPAPPGPGDEHDDFFTNTARRMHEEASAIKQARERPNILPSPAKTKSDPAVSHVFLPSQLHGLNLPAPPKTHPTFIVPTNVADDDSQYGQIEESQQGTQQLPHTILLTPRSPLPSSSHTHTIDKEATLGQIDDILANSPNSPHHRRLVAQREQQKVVDVAQRMEAYDAAVEKEEMARKQMREGIVRDEDDDEEEEEDVEARYHEQQLHQRPPLHPHQHVAASEQEYQQSLEAEEAEAEELGFSPFFVLNRSKGATENSEAEAAAHHFNDDNNRGHDRDDLASVSDDQEAGEDEAADQQFEVQKEHFRRGLDIAEAEIRKAPLSPQPQQQPHEEKEEQTVAASQSNTHSSGLRVSISAVGRPVAGGAGSVPFDHTNVESGRRSVAPLAPLHSRTLSEIDWFATGPLDPTIKRKKHMTARERAEEERASKLINPYVLFTTKEEEPTTVQLQPPPHASSHHHLSIDVSSAQPSPTSSSNLASATTTITTTTPNVGALGAAAPAAVKSRAEWWSRKAVHAPAAPVSSRPKAPKAAAPAVMRSTVPGMGDEAYHASFVAAVANLLKLGYSDKQAMEFAPHLVLAGVIQAPPPRVEQITEPHNVSRVFQNRAVARSTPVYVGPAQPSSAHPSPGQHIANHDLAWIGGMPASQLYTHAAPSPAAAVPIQSQPLAGSTSARVVSHTRSSSTRPPSAASSSYAAPAGSRTAQPKRPSSAIPSSVRASALAAGIPTSLVQPVYQQHVSTAPRPPSAASRPGTASTRKASLKVMVNEELLHNHGNNFLLSPAVNQQMR